MAQVINTNIASLNAQRNLNTSQTATNTALQRLSTGLRINSAKDDAAGLAISERMSTQITGLNQAVRNSNDGISLAQTAESALSQIGTNLQRIRELAVQSRNATNSSSDREALQKEVTQLSAEISRVAKDTSFNGTKLIDGSFNAQAFQVGADQGQTISVAKIANAKVDQLGDWTSAGVAATSTGVAPIGNGQTSTTYAITSADNTITLNGATITVAGATYTGSSDATAKTAYVAALNTAINTAAGTENTLEGIEASIGTDGKITLTNTAGGNAATVTVTAATGAFAGLDAGTIATGASGTGTGTLATTATKPFAAVSTGEFTLSGTDGATYSIEVADAGDAATRLKNLVSAVNAKTGNTGVTASIDGGKLKLSSEADFTVGSSLTANEFAAQTGLTAGTSTYTAGVAKTGFADLDISNVEGADNAILAMDAALKSVNESRADLGAIQNRFSSVVSSLQTTSENLSASRSRIVDTDFAAETASLTRAQILQQAGTAMLAQANSLPNNVLTLLRG